MKNFLYKNTASCPSKNGTSAANRRKEDEIDLVELARHIWDRRLFIAKVTGVFVVIGLLVALLSPVEYRTEATLMPEV